jgi:CelD/BcsL family acetyltransferase involved in cellulose biosynthesis
MNILEIDPLQDPRWKTLVDGHASSSIYHRAEWLLALKLTYDYEPVAVTTSAAASSLSNALVFCKIKSPFTGRRLVSLPFSDHCEPLVDRTSDFHALSAHVIHIVDQQHWGYLEIRPIREIPELPRRFGISHNYFFHLLDLRPSEEALFRSFHKDSVQRRIRRAEGQSLQYEEGTSETLLKQFYKLLIITRRRHRLPPQPLKWFRNLVATFGSDSKIRVALKAGTPIASIFTINHKKTMVYKYGCSDHRFNNLGGTPFLFWHAIQDAKASGFEQLDMGRSDTDNPGLVAFKERWGAERSALKYWRYPATTATEEPERAIRYAKRIIAIAPDISLVMLGNLLYRHIG